jgi:glycosyltransferase involved in cell wall biosynthesis
MKVLIWCPLVNLGGGIRLLSQLAPALARSPDVETVRLAVPPGFGWGGCETSGVPRLELYEIASSRSGRVKRWLRREGRVLGIKGTGRVKNLFSRWLPDNEADEKGEWEAGELRRAASGFDVVYAFWPHRQKFHSLGKPLVCTFQDATLLDFPEILGREERDREFALSDEWLRASSLVVVSSQATRSNLVRLFGQRYESAVVIPHAILPAGQRADAVLSPELARRLPGRYVVFPANINAHKNHYALLVAWSRFARRGEFPLVMFGEGTEALTSNVRANLLLDRLRGLIARTGLRAGEDFHALGYIADADVLPVIGGAAALVMPTLAEGGGSYPVEEALSVGVPVLCSDIPVMREHLAGRTAKVGWFDPESADSILRALEDLFDNYDEYRRSALSAASDVRYTWDDIASQYVRAFRAAIEKTGNEQH